MSFWSYFKKVATFGYDCVKRQYYRTTLMERLEHRIGRVAGSYDIVSGAGFHSIVDEKDSDRLHLKHNDLVIINNEEAKIYDEKSKSLIKINGEMLIFTRNNGVFFYDFEKNIFVYLSRSKSELSSSEMIIDYYKDKRRNRNKNITPNKKCQDIILQKLSEKQIDTKKIDTEAVGAFSEYVAQTLVFSGVFSMLKDEVVHFISTALFVIGIVFMITALAPMLLVLAIVAPITYLISAGVSIFEAIRNKNEFDVSAMVFSLCSAVGVLLTGIVAVVAIGAGISIGFATIMTAPVSIPIELGVLFLFGTGLAIIGSIGGTIIYCMKNHEKIKNNLIYAYSSTKEFIITTSKKLENLLEKSVNFFLKLSSKCDDFFDRAWNKGINGIKKSSNKCVASVKKTWNTCVNSIKNTSKKLDDLLGKGVNFVLKLSSKCDDFLDRAWNKGINSIKKSSNKCATFVKTTWNTCVNSIKNTSKKLDDLLGKGVNFVLKLSSKCDDFLDRAWNKGINGIKKSSNKCAAFAKKAPKTISKAFKNFFGRFVPRRLRRVESDNNERKSKNPHITKTKVTQSNVSSSNKIAEIMLIASAIGCPTGGVYVHHTLRMIVQTMQVAHHPGMILLMSVAGISALYTAVFNFLKRNNDSQANINIGHNLDNIVQEASMIAEDNATNAITNETIEVNPVSQPRL